MTAASACLPHEPGRSSIATSLDGSPLPLRWDPSMPSTFAALLSRLFRCISRAPYAAFLSICRTRIDHSFDGGDDEILFTHFAPPLAADGLSRFTADTQFLAT